MNWFIGIDLGSAYSKGVVSTRREVLASHVIRSGTDSRASAEAVRTELVRRANVTEEDIVLIVATGPGADNAVFASQKASDIICTARGMNSIFPQARTVIDVASLSTKAIRLDDQGRVTNFAVTEKCAAGGGRFIEVIANVLRVDLTDISQLCAMSRNPVEFGTGCAVFAESEAITRVSEGVAKEDIAAGVTSALASKVSSLVRKMRPEEPVAICGGGALNTFLVKSIESELQVTLLVPPNPQIITALGAAVMARTLAAQ